MFVAVVAAVVTVGAARHAARLWHVRRQLLDEVVLLPEQVTPGAGRVTVAGVAAGSPVRCRWTGREGLLFDTVEVDQSVVPSGRRGRPRVVRRVLSSETAAERFVVRGGPIDVFVPSVPRPEFVGFSKTMFTNGQRQQSGPASRYVEQVDVPAGMAVWVTGEVCPGGPVPAFLGGVVIAASSPGSRASRLLPPLVGWGVTALVAMVVMLSALG